jgi:hypothetical protein
MDSSRSMNARTMAVLALFGLVATFAVPSVMAATYYGPSFTTPTAIVPGGTINIVLTTGQGSSVVELPHGPSNTCAGTCVYPQSEWTSNVVGTPSNPSPNNCFYSVHEVTVTDPYGNEYMLGSASTSGLFWPNSIGGPVQTSYNTPQSPSTTPYPPADALNVTNGDSFTIPFGAGAGGFSFTSNLVNPPNDLSTAGPYYWWSVSGNTVYGANVRIDTQPTVNPTLTHGTYVVDIEGEVVCPSGTMSFSVYHEFDAPNLVTTPQFPFSAALVAVTGLAALLVLRQKVLVKHVP